MSDLDLWYIGGGYTGLFPAGIEPQFSEAHRAVGTGYLAGRQTNGARDGYAIPELRFYARCLYDECPYCWALSNGAAVRAWQSTKIGLGAR